MRVGEPCEGPDRGHQLQQPVASSGQGGIQCDSSEEESEGVLLLRPRAAGDQGCDRARPGPHGRLRLHHGRRRGLQLRQHPDEERARLRPQLPDRDLRLETLLVVMSRGVNWSDSEHNLIKVPKSQARKKILNLKHFFTEKSCSR